MKATPVVLDAVDKTDAHTSGAVVPTSITITATPRQQSVGDAVTVTGSITITQVAGYEGILTGFAAIYAGLAQVIDEMYRKSVAPLGRGLDARPNPTRRERPDTAPTENRRSRGR